MVCTNCGSEIPEGDLFCSVCGQRAPETVPAEEVPEAVVTDDNWEAPVATEPEKPKKGLKFWLLLSGIALVVAALVVVVIFIIKANGPAAAIYNGVKNVLDEKSFTVHIEGEGDNDDIEIDMQVEMDPDNREVSLLHVYTEDDNEPDMIAIYDGYLIESRYNYEEYYNEYTGEYSYERGDPYYVAYDISEPLESFFDSYERLEDGDSSLEEMLDNLVDDIGEEYLEEEYEEMKDHVNLEVLEDCLKTYCQMLNDEDWMEENANLTIEEKDGMTLYCLEPDMHDFVMASMEYFREAFEDEDEYEELEEFLEDEAKKDLEETHAEITIGIEDGYLVYGAMDGETRYDTYELTMEITDIGETEVDKEMLDDILNDADIREVNW